ncbi:methyltransferase domain-containing protein [Actinacidiphila acididurans]|uniref:Protein-L-isoaspartate O-methyltransferase n=1 Tax=Actinacidiphila acididurans TaxID=2784346 RepID=A0ABS2TYJ2_9ACTN|nr:methyltransferase domain-containing protein [Actinacidiphila acididurans]MBM9508384.1 methyltransferase domain-containing protein [Actinacidiphila acididurans]
MAETAQEQRYRVAARALRARMVRRIVAGGGLTDPAWRQAFAEVPRHLFVPVSVPGGNPSGGPGGANDPRSVLRRLSAAYADRPIATRVVAGELVSSISQPSLMAQMCQALDLRDGQRVLEIGAGTGYNAALLAHRLGPGAVTTVDLDPEITTAARANLAAYGTSAARSVVVVTGDGALGHPDGAPYDRIVATCELPAVPPAWLAQVRPGGLILAPVATGLALLTVHGPERAEGRFLPTSAYFVPLRGPGMVAAPVAGPFSGRHPARTRFGLTVHGTRQWLWLDDPRGPRTWPLSPAAG